MKKIIKYTSFIMVLVLSVLVLLNEKIIYALTDLKSFTSIEDVQFFNSGEKFSTKSMGIYGGMIMYVDKNDEVLAIDILNTDNTEINEYHIGDVCAKTFEYNENSVAEENLYVYGCKTIYQKENNNIQSIKKWKSIKELGDIYELDQYGYNTGVFAGAYIENEFYNSEDYRSYLNENTEFRYNSYLKNEINAICDLYGKMFPENLECSSDYGNILFYDDVEEDGYNLLIGSGWYWSSPLYILKEVPEPTFTLECDKKELYKDEEVSCILKTNAEVTLNKIETTINTGELELSKVEGLNNWEAKNEEKDITLNHNEGIKGESETAKITLVNKENSEKKINVSLENIKYVDESGENNYENLTTDLSLKKKVENPETSDLEVILCMFIIISGISLIILNIRRVKSFN